MADSPTRSAIARLIERQDHDRFLTALFAPAERREDLFALYAFNYEVAKTREVVREPILGQIRLQWWRESIDAIYRGASMRRHEVVEPLAVAIRRHDLTRYHFDRIIDAREHDLGDAPPATLVALEHYVEETSSRLIWLTLEILGVREQPAIEVGREVGLAFALSGLLHSVMFHARAKRLYLPADLVTAAGLRVQEDLFELKGSPALLRVVAAVADAAQQHLARARSRRRDVPLTALPALLPAVLAARNLRQLRRVGFNVFDQRLGTGDARTSWGLVRAALIRRY